ncbi:L-seryl-tRNA(Ser) seleniumtransferase [Entomoplasma freundtii]|uniref:L-seryl-tRNA selenium transferase n=1 Tax=Entomoplasma freundtii TaxID=74700 RepID=A0A2K8NSH3_9MOLU|nr:aminotransferase class V-fold PLP-dependent enzyme [Entomoplasma freundtii]ATZ16108.1 L-seryl-tRNA selenium transferase [Entomoplasma freundtii]TDY56991.1 L-seryl-tRNA(Ser) seleniumtransferase [Entomoplasma freundtii]
MNINEEINLKKVINADGRMTILGVSTISDDVGEAMKSAGQSYFVMKDLEKNVDQQVAKMYGYEAAHIVNSASAGIALGITALIYGDRIHDVNVQVPQKKEIILLKGHNINFGAPMEDILHLVGAKVSEAGYANGCSIEDVEYKINENTVALMYVLSHHTIQKQILSLEEMIDIAKKHHIPLIVDCAAESDLFKYAAKAIDLVIFSGAKAIEGPTSGIVFGGKLLIENITKHHKNIGRVMKIGKENIIGLFVALKNYQNKKQNIQAINYLNILGNNPYVKGEIVVDALRPEIQRIKISLQNNAKIDAIELSQKLKSEGDIAIYLRDYWAKQNLLEIDLRSIDLEEMRIINRRLIELLGDQKNEQN